MNVKIRPAWVLSLGVMLAMFVVARIYIGKAIENETRTPEAVEPGVPRVRGEQVAPIERREDPGTTARGIVYRPLAQLSAVAEAGDEAGRTAYYEAVRRDIAAVDQQAAHDFPPNLRAGVLERYDDVLTTDEAAPVKAELSRLRADLARWFASAPNQAVVHEPPSEEPEERPAEAIEDEIEDEAPAPAE